MIKYHNEEGNRYLVLFNKYVFTWKYGTVCPGGYLLK